MTEAWQKDRHWWSWHRRRALRREWRRQFAIVVRLERERSLRGEG